MRTYTSGDAAGENGGASYRQKARNTKTADPSICVNYAEANGHPHGMLGGMLRANPEVIAAYRSPGLEFAAGVGDERVGPRSYKRFPTNGDPVVGDPGSVSQVSPSIVRRSGGPLGRM